MASESIEEEQRLTLQLRRVQPATNRAQETKNKNKLQRNASTPDDPPY